MPDILSIPELAKLLGTTEAAVRNKIYKNPSALPPWFRDGTKYRWSQRRVLAWIEKRQQEGEQEHARRSSYRRSA